jgi:hypothetical protein
MSFAETVFKFYPSEVFKQHLSDPYSFTEVDSVFQDAAATLLSLSGCSVVILGKKEYVERATPKKKKLYDVLRTSTGYEHGSVDLIAYYKEKEKLGLVDCTTRIPDDSKIRNLQQIVNQLSSKEERNYSKVFGIIPSPRDCSDIKHTYFDDIHIIDKSSLERILNFIVEGKTEDARKEFFF